MTQSSLEGTISIRHGGNHEEHNLGCSGRRHDIGTDHSVGWAKSHSASERYMRVIEYSSSESERDFCHDPQSCCQRVWLRHIGCATRGLPYAACSEVAARPPCAPPRRATELTFGLLENSIICWHGVIHEEHTLGSPSLSRDVGSVDRVGRTPPRFSSSIGSQRQYAKLFGCQ